MYTNSLEQTLCEKNPQHHSSSVADCTVYAGPWSVFFLDVKKADLIL